MEVSPILICEDCAHVQAAALWRCSCGARLCADCARIHREDYGHEAVLAPRVYKHGPARRAAIRQRVQKYRQRQALRCSQRSG